MKVESVKSIAGIAHAHDAEPHLCRSARYQGRRISKEEPAIDGGLSAECMEKKQVLSLRWRCDYVLPLSVWFGWRGSVWRGLYRSGDR